MAAPTKLISTSVGFQDAAGNVVALGLLSLTLSQNAEVTASGGQVTAAPLYLPLDANGKITSTAIWFNDELTPSGTTYRAVLYAANQIRIIQDFGDWSITGASSDLSTMVPVSAGGALIAGVVLTAPAVTQTVVQPSGTSLNVNRFENIRYADQFSGATADIKIAAAISDLPSGGGVVDARGFGAGNQTIAATVTVGTASKPVTLLCDPSTTFIPGSTSIDMFSIGPNGIIEGVTIDCSSVSTYSGNAVEFIGNMTDGMRGRLSNFLIFNGTVSAGVTTGTAVLLHSVNNVNGVGFVSIEKGRIVGFANGLYLNSGGTSGSVYFVNANHFHDIEIKNAVTGINLNSASGDILGNLFLNCDVQSGPQSTTGIIIQGAGTNQYANMWTNCNIWDFTGQTPISFSANSSRNFFFGQYNAGTISDSSTAATNNIWNLFGNASGNAWKWNLNSDLLLNVATNAHGLQLKVPAAQWNIQPQSTSELAFVLSGVADVLHLLNTGIYPATAGAISVGLVSSPFSSAFIGAAATNNIQVTGTATGSRVFTLQDQTGTGIVRTGSTSQKSESAADTNVLTVTPLAQAGTYRLTFILSISAAASAVVGWTATWTDSNGAAQTPTNLALFQSGTAAPALTFTTSAASNYYASAVIDINNAATNIVVKFTLASGTITAKATATVERLI